MLRYEQECWACGVSRVAGVDEAGRGPLAGPVVAAAFVFNRDVVDCPCSAGLAGLTDSKQLTESARNTFFAFLKACEGVDIGVGVSSVEEIDRFNILRATHLAMRRAVESLSVLPERILVDGRPVPGFPVVSTAIVKGDSLSLSIAAASVIAKVTRDRMMKDLHELYPQYGFAKHKGYGTAQHMQALLDYGPAPVHRRSFRPVREADAIHRRQWEGRPSEALAPPPVLSS